MPKSDGNIHKTGESAVDGRCLYYQGGDQLRNMETILQLQGSSASSLTPLFLIHPISGLALSYFALGELSQYGQRPVFGINSPMFSRVSYNTPSTLEELASNYVKLLQEVQPQGPYLLGGWSMGGMIAMRMAAILEKAHERILHVVMIDSMNPDTVPPFQTTREHGDLVTLTYNRLVNSSQALARPTLHRFDSSSSIESDYNSYSERKSGIRVSVARTLSSTSSGSSSEEDLSSFDSVGKKNVPPGIPDGNYEEDDYSEDSTNQASDSLSIHEMRDCMKRHISNGLWLIAGRMRIQQRQGKEVLAPITQFKCNMLEELPRIMSPIRKQAIEANFADPRCGWKDGRLQTMLLSSAHDRVFDANNVGELTVALRTLLDKCA